MGCGRGAGCSAGSGIPDIGCGRRLVRRSRLWWKMAAGAPPNWACQTPQARLIHQGGGFSGLCQLTATAPNNLGAGVRRWTKILSHRAGTDE